MSYNPNQSLTLLSDTQSYLRDQEANSLIPKPVPTWKKAVLGLTTALMTGSIVGSAYAKTGNVSEALLDALADSPAETSAEGHVYEGQAIDAVAHLVQPQEGTGSPDDLDNTIQAAIDKLDAAAQRRPVSTLTKLAITYGHDMDGEGTDGPYFTLSDKWVSPELKTVMGMNSIDSIENLAHVLYMTAFPNIGPELDEGSELYRQTVIPLRDLIMTLNGYTHEDGSLDFEAAEKIPLNQPIKIGYSSEESRENGRLDLSAMRVAGLTDDQVDLSRSMVNWLSTIEHSAFVYDRFLPELKAYLADLSARAHDRDIKIEGLQQQAEDYEAQLEAGTLDLEAARDDIVTLGRQANLASFMSRVHILNAEAATSKARAELAEQSTALKKLGGDVTNLSDQLAAEGKAKRDAQFKLLQWQGKYRTQTEELHATLQAYEQERAEHQDTKEDRSYWEAGYQRIFTKWFYGLTDLNAKDAQISELEAAITVLESQNEQAASDVREAELKTQATITPSVLDDRENDTTRYDVTVTVPLDFDEGVPSLSLTATARYRGLDKTTTTQPWQPEDFPQVGTPIGDEARTYVNEGGFFEITYNQPDKPTPWLTNSQTVERLSGDMDGFSLGLAGKLSDIARFAIELGNDFQTAETDTTTSSVLYKQGTDRPDPSPSPLPSVETNDSWNPFVNAGLDVPVLETSGPVRELAARIVYEDGIARAGPSVNLGNLAILGAGAGLDIDERFSQDGELDPRGYVSADIDLGTLRLGNFGFGLAVHGEVQATPETVKKLKGGLRVKIDW
tara:strand:+ start:15 stop:2375 length:2361 start_codon:yes stop_codon:yes gene_type:complete